MTKDVSYINKVDTGLKQLHCPAVPHGVARQPFRNQLRRDFAGHVSIGV